MKKNFLTKARAVYLALNPRQKTLSVKSQRLVATLDFAHAKSVLLGLTNLDPEVLSQLSHGPLGLHQAFSALHHPAQTTEGAWSVLRQHPDIAHNPSLINWKNISTKAGLKLLEYMSLDLIMQVNNQDLWSRFENAIVQKVDLNPATLTHQHSIQYINRLTDNWHYISPSNQHLLAKIFPYYTTVYQKLLWPAIRKDSSIIDTFLKSHLELKQTSTEETSFTEARFLLEILQQNQDAIEDDLWISLIHVLARTNPLTIINELQLREFHWLPEGTLEILLVSADNDLAAKALGSRAHDWLVELGQESKEVEYINLIANPFIAFSWKNLPSSAPLSTRWALWQKTQPLLTDRAEIELQKPKQSKRRSSLWRSLWDNKNPEYFITAAAQLAEANPPLFFKLIQKLGSHQLASIPQSIWSKLLTHPSRDVRIQAIQAAPKYLRQTTQPTQPLQQKDPAPRSIKI